MQWYPLVASCLAKSTHSHDDAHVMIAVFFMIRWLWLIKRFVTGAYLSFGFLDWFVYNVLCDDMQSIYEWCYHENNAPAMQKEYGDDFRIWWFKFWTHGLFRPMITIVGTHFYTSSFTVYYLRMQKITSLRWYCCFLYGHQSILFHRHNLAYKQMGNDLEFVFDDSLHISPIHSISSHHR